MTITSIKIEQYAGGMTDLSTNTCNKLDMSWTMMLIQHWRKFPIAWNHIFRSLSSNPCLESLGRRLVCFLSVRVTMSCFRSGLRWKCLNLVLIWQRPNSAEPWWRHMSRVWRHNNFILNKSCYFAGSFTQSHWKGQSDRLVFTDQIYWLSLWLHELQEPILWNIYSQNFIVVSG